MEAGLNSGPTPDPPYVDDNGTYHCTCGASHSRGPVDPMANLYRCMACGETQQVEGDHNPGMRKFLPHIIYRRDYDGKWTRYEAAGQCREDVFLAGRCQGSQGHKGVHWCYTPSGNFAWDDNAEDPQHDGCAGDTPPGHETYPDPVKQREQHYMSHLTHTEVTDPEVIKSLEAGKPPEWWASVDRPLTADEYQKLMEEGILPE